MLRHVHEVGNGAQNDHVGGPGVAGGLGELVDAHAEALAVVLQLEVLGVVDDYAALSHLVEMRFVGLFIEGHQHVQFIAIAEDWRSGDAGLSERGPSHDL